MAQRPHLTTAAADELRRLSSQWLVSVPVLLDYLVHHAQDTVPDEDLDALRRETFNRTRR